MLTVAVEGCCHGQLNAIYKSLPAVVDLLIICGDFQSVRNAADLKCLAVPQKYRQMGDFQDYYTGRRKAPVMTIFVGGNHEASNYLTELKHGGFVAPNIYYLGQSGVVWYKGLRIAGISGIYNEPHFYTARTETLPYDRSTIRSVYHYRHSNLLPLQLLRPSNETIMISHDWPEGIYDYGLKDQLLKNKPFFKTDIERRCLGSPPLMGLLRHLRPRYWFSAHLHTKFEANVPWKSARPEEKLNVQEIDLDLELTPSSTDSLPTRFLALDKCLPRRKYLEILRLAQTEMPANLKGLKFSYDPEYISIIQTVSKYQDQLETEPSDELVSEILEKCQERREQLESLDPKEYRKLMNIDVEFVRTAPAKESTVQEYINPQTVRFTEKFLAQPLK
ncbi:hypothetical protein OGAPHI_004952 [Ogataea philodendri]|uniref:Lariat debranching enzyme C-terminal domain-containing protein n=1 Tax=Ogataea philodendri TaxID=1378263 RepID=A0A9P8P208_9ASCO|nr:uncharacterized protein OGAPHI_004952 [Ogataea philodendri]KAH3663551.1 hypothetical protein OGAPHI_004952 [Ogataea philodendri]